MIYLLSSVFSVSLAFSLALKQIVSRKLPPTSDAAAGAEHDKVFPSRASWSSAPLTGKSRSSESDGRRRFSVCIPLPNVKYSTKKKERKSPAVARHVPLHEIRALLIGRPAVEKHCLFSL